MAMEIMLLAVISPSLECEWALSSVEQVCFLLFSFSYRSHATITIHYQLYSPGPQHNLRLPWVDGLVTVLGKSVRCARETGGRIVFLFFLHFFLILTSLYSAK